MNKKKKKADAPSDWDDGRTISPMTAGWMPWNVGNRPPKEKNKSEAAGTSGTSLTKGERRGLLRGLIRAYLPAFLCIAATFLLLWFFARFWLGGAGATSI